MCALGSGDCITQPWVAQPVHGGPLPLGKAGERHFLGGDCCLHNGLLLASETFRIRKGKGPTQPFREFSGGIFLIWALHRPALSGTANNTKRRNTPGLPTPRFSIHPNAPKKNFFAFIIPEIELCALPTKQTSVVRRATYQSQGISSRCRQCGILKRTTRSRLH